MSNLDTKLLGILDAGIEVRIIKRQHGYQVTLKQDSPNGGCPYGGQSQSGILSLALRDAYNQLHDERYGYVDDAGENE